VVECRSHVCDGAISVRGFIGQTSMLVTDVGKYEKKNAVLCDILQDIWSVVLS
jgi:hypothetical protein